MSNFIETRGMLSKLLATENLHIEHSKEAITASFDTESRVLTLPILKTNSENVYNLFCAHEVGHALQTPQYWKKDIPDGVPSDFINVVEDVRIEKYIQSKFPGLRTDFTKGYDELNKNDFFKILDKDLSKFSFIDRINLHFKLGARAFVPFSEDEMVYVRAVDEADTWDKVLLVSKMIHDYIGSKTTNEMPNDEQQDGGSDEQQDGESDQQTESNQLGDSDSDGGNDMSSDGQTNLPSEEISETQRSFDESLESIVDDSTYGIQYVYAVLGDIKLDNIIVSNKELRDDIAVGDSVASLDVGRVDDERSKLNDYLKSIKSDVNHMVQQFEMKKSADAYARQQTHKTGVLDTNKLHNYKLTDDLFLRQSVTPDGKCHGMVMYLDWSGSMENICHDTVKQILTLVQFCRKVQIPFEVYTFTTGSHYYPEQSEVANHSLAHETVRLVQVLTSNAKKREIDDDMFNLWCAAVRIRSSYHGVGLPWSFCYQMGGTPLDNALILVPSIINRFKENTGAQKVSFVCITDGESAPLQYYEYKDTQFGNPVGINYCHYKKMMLRNGHSVFPLEPRDTGEVVQWVKSHVTDVSMINIFLGKSAASKNHLRSYDVALNEKVFRKTGSYVTSSRTWPIIGVMNPINFGDTTDELDVDAGVSKAKIKSALNKMMKTKSSARMILTELVGQFA